MSDTPTFLRSPRPTEQPRSFGQARSPRCKSVIFDMDGTITKPFFDFNRIRAEIGDVPEPILEQIDLLPEDRRRRAWEILERHEAEAAAKAELNDGAREVVDLLRAKKMPMGLVTRNSRRSVDVVLRKLALSFDAVMTRDDGPVKPRPDAILHICRRFEISPGDAVVIGDYLYDIEAGRAAGCRTALLTNGKPPKFHANPDMTISRLSDLIPLINGLLQRNGQ